MARPTGLSHVEEPPGTLVVSISRPPGTHGVTGTGVVCVLTFQAKASGQSGLAITRASVVNGAQQQVPVAEQGKPHRGQVGNRAHESATLHSDPAAAQRGLTLV